MRIELKIADGSLWVVLTDDDYNYYGDSISLEDLNNALKEVA